MNWADARDNFQSGWVIPTGLAASDSYSTVYGIAEKTLEGFNAQGVTTVRLPINTASVVNSSWWPNYKATVDAATALGMKVILSYWDSNSTGTVDPDWKAMWETVTQDYGRYANVHFEIMNEPDGYSASQWEGVADAWVKTFTAAPYDVPVHHVIVSAVRNSAENCVGWMQNDLSGVANDPVLKGTLLSVHFYNWCNAFDDSAMFGQLVAPYISHGVVIDEFGTPVGSGGSWVDFGSLNSPDQNVQYLHHLATALHNSGVGAVYWPGLRRGDSYSVWILDSNGNLVPNGNNSILPWLRYAWT